jgi:hypothetical protein
VSDKPQNVSAFSAKLSDGSSLPLVSESGTLIKTVMALTLHAALFLTLHAGSLKAGIITHSFTITLDPSQIVNGLTKDVWTSPDLILPPTPLNAGDTLILDVNFGPGPYGQFLQVSDFFANGDESIHFFLNGTGGIGGGELQTLDYSWTFTDVMGGLLVNPVLGSGTLSGNTGNAQILPGTIVPLDPSPHRSLDLTTSSFCFGDITLSMLVPATITGPWTPSLARLSVDGEDVQISPCPEPGSFVLCGAGFIAALIGRRHLKSRKATARTAPESTTVS